MTDLSNMCLIDKNALKKLTLELTDDNGWVASVVMQSLNQDLSGMVVVPVVATDDMIDIAFEYLSFNDEDEVDELFKRMLEAAPKLDWTDGNL